MPTSITEISSFLGLAGYYRRFIEGFAQLAAPLMKLTRKGIEFDWTKECEENFQELKLLFVTAPVLAVPTPGMGYTIYCDASKIGLKYIFNQKQLNKRQRRWLELLKDYDVTINYHPGFGNP
jgi:hypothetical protein